MGAKCFNWRDPQDDEALVVGAMTGTSMDGIDVCLVRVSPGTWKEELNKNQNIRVPTFGEPVKVITTYAASFNAEFRSLLHSFCNLGMPMTAEQICEIRDNITKVHCNAITKLMESAQKFGIVESDLSLIVVHGQTVYHRPPLSWQMIDPAPIACKFNTDVLYDLRAADLASGGQGAPITPLADVILFRRYARSTWKIEILSTIFDTCLFEDLEDVWVVNLGGFCNITLINSENYIHDGFARGRDVCAVNQLLNFLSENLLDKPMDEDGAVAAEARQYEESADNGYYTEVERLFTTFLEAQSNQSTSRSLGSDDSLHYKAWLERALQVADESGERDVKKINAIILRSACGAIAHTIWASINDVQSWTNRNTMLRGSATVILAGGGVLNKTLEEKLKSGGRKDDRVVTSEEIAGIGVCDRESVSMAVLGAISRMGIPITHKSVTGCGGLFAPAGSALFSRPSQEEYT